MNFDIYQFNERHGTYGGKGGMKEGITIDGEYWIVKTYADTDFRTSAPLSEYIGSHIYQILGIDAQETELGIRNGKLVVACKDFCKHEGSLREIRTIKNVYSKELSKALKECSSKSDDNSIPLETMLVHLKYNPVLQEVQGIQKRFWEQLIVDMLISNNDRNDAAWGVLYENGSYRPAPVFHNRSAFSNNTSVYTIDDRHIRGEDLVTITDDCYLKTALELIPTINSKLPEIYNFIYGIPEKFGEFDVCSNTRKQFYIKTVERNYEKYLVPVYELAKGKSK